MPQRLDRHEAPVRIRRSMSPSRSGPLTLTFNIAWSVRRYQRTPWVFVVFADPVRLPETIIFTFTLTKSLSDKATGHTHRAMTDSRRPLGSSRVVQLLAIAAFCLGLTGCYLTTRQK